MIRLSSGITERRKLAGFCHTSIVFTSRMQANGYSVGEVRLAGQLRRTARAVESVSQENVGFAMLPYTYGVTDRIGRLLSRHGVKLIFKPTKTIQEFLRPVKDIRDPLLSCIVYGIPCSCG